MTDEIRIYHREDPDDAPERRLGAYPSINPYIPTSLPQYIIPQVQQSLYAAMRYYWYQAFHHGIAVQHQHQQQHQQQHQHRNQHQEQHHQHQHPHQHQHQHRLQPQEQQNQHQEQHHQEQQQPLRQEQYQQQVESPSSVASATPSSSSSSDSTAGRHIKKPLNPFMIFMQKRRPEIVKLGIIKESAAINQMLGQQWRKLSKEEQEPYYKLAEQEKILHAQKYPGWSARDNYQKKKKKMKLKSISFNGLDQLNKKCRARFGLNNMSSWCKPCRRKKRCIYNKPRQ